MLCRRPPHGQPCRRAHSAKSSSTEVRKDQKVRPRFNSCPIMVCSLNEDVQRGHAVWASSLDHAN